jgi:hypothetical protein|tara:strand:+ start:2570 stop:2995 length:426 start_codon:yes stop_codon:yes gene_type:complete
MRSNPAIRKGHAVLCWWLVFVSAMGFDERWAQLIWRLCRQGAIKCPVDYLGNRNLRGCGVHPFPLVIQFFAQTIDGREFPPAFHLNLNLNLNLNLRAVSRLAASASGSRLAPCPFSSYKYLNPYRSSETVPAKPILNSAGA